MSCDRDIFWCRIIAQLLVGANVGMGINNLLAHNWLIAATCFLWVFSLFLTIQTMKTQQITRDQGRVIQAGLDAMRHEIETGEY